MAFAAENCTWSRVSQARFHFLQQIQRVSKKDGMSDHCVTLEGQSLDP